MTPMPRPGGDVSVTSARCAPEGPTGLAAYSFVGLGENGVEGPPPRRRALAGSVVLAVGAALLRRGLLG